jgi:dihydropteroate synthase
MDRLYIRPFARMAPLADAPLPELPTALAVADRADLHFALAEIIERDGAMVRRRILAAEALADTAASWAALQELIERIRRPRAAVAGLALDRPRIVGIVNVTPDSFSDGGQHLAPDAAVAHALQLEAEGADILDIGGESTRPGSEAVDLEEECRRVLPVIAQLAKRVVRARLSIDTRKAEVMRRAAHAGVHLINDVSALTHDAQSLRAAAETGLPVVLMHAQGDPRTMQVNPRYDDVALDVYDALGAWIAACERAGMPRSRLIVDPGIGFGKTMLHNLALLSSLTVLHGLGCPIMLGASRKSFIGRLTGDLSAGRLSGSVAAALVGAAQGVQFLRVHDVAATRQALAVWEGAMGGAAPPA